MPRPTALTPSFILVVFVACMLLIRTVVWSEVEEEEEGTMISLRRFPEPGPSPWIPFRHETVTFTQKTTATMATPPNPVPDFEFHGFKRSELLAAFQRQGRCASDPVPEIHFVTFANKRPKDSKFCRSLISAAQNRIPLTVLGWGVPYKGLGSKLSHSLDFASRLPPCDLVVFMDAYDVLFAHGPERIKADLLRIDPDGSKGVLFSGECGCWPQTTYSNGKHVCETVYPTSPTAYRYINTGLWATRAGAAVSLLAYVQSASTSKAEFEASNDQELIGNMYIALLGGDHPADLAARGHYVPIAVDHAQALFQNFHPSGGCAPENDFTFDAEGNPRNTATGSSPSMLHFSGGGKDTLLSVEHGMWYKQPNGSVPMKPRLYTPAELTEFEVTLADGVTKLSFRDTECGDASQYDAIPKWKSKW